MATASSSVCDPRNDRSGVNIHFVDEDELPLAHFVEHRVSEEEFYSDESGFSDEESDESTSDEDLDEEIVAEAQDWSNEINLRKDVEFQEEVGINVNSENLRSCLDFFLLFFTAEVWTLLVEQTNLYGEQRRGHQESSVWYPVTIDEMKGWVSLYLNMGLVTKPNLTSYWSTDPSLSSPFFTSIMEPFLDKGCYVFMDNYYTSVALFEELEERKTLACWTVRSNRSGLPKEICGIQEKKVKQLKRGESLYRQKGNVTCVTWRDRKPVSVLATIPTSDADGSAIQRSVKVSGTWEKRDFARPGVIDKYNTYMGGVDLSDQRAVSYARLMRGVVWYYKVFFYMLEVCVSNAHILHSKCPDHASITSFNFRKSVVKALVEGKCFSRDAGLPQIPVAIPEIRFNRDHFHHLISHDTRSTCKVHIQEVKASYTCAICGVRMCIEPCFKRYHTMQD